MAFKVNYGLERAERNRAKLAKKESKSLARKANADGPATDKVNEDAGHDVAGTNQSSEEK
jgi:hypothetical protein